ncbi:MAG: ribosome-associated translation inhibitor RaiA [Actinomycetota bacterium]|nr:ribosome-associated translation inhibitor RaiA [Actinomycetota bacterium]
MEIVVRGRNVEVPEHFRTHVSERLRRIERYDHKLIRIDVELLHERNPRQSDCCQRIELTCKSRGPAVRSEACASDFYAALDQACTRLENRFRRSADRRRVHHGRHTPTSVATATAAVAAKGYAVPAGPLAEAMSSSDGHQSADSTEQSVLVDDHLPGRIVREKEHTAVPMSTEQALFEMELVGHDFYLFSDVATGAPSVVYRRKGYDYGVIRLTGSQHGATRSAR